MTHTYAGVPISATAFEEIAAKLRAAAYHENFIGQGVISMQGLALEKEPPAAPRDCEVDRVAFEAWCTDTGRNADRNSDGDYKYLQTRCDWPVWQAAMLRALAERMFEWRPIETAPKSGVILLGRFNRAGRWESYRGGWVSQEEISEHWENDDCEEGWYEQAVEPDEPNCFGTSPTHWQYLPPPPLTAVFSKQEVADG